MTRKRNVHVYCVTRHLQSDPISNVMSILPLEITRTGMERTSSYGSYNNNSFLGGAISLQLI